MKITREASELCNVIITGEKKIGHYRFLEGLTVHPTYLPYFKKNDRPLGRHPHVWLDDIIFVTRIIKKRTHQKTGIGTYKTGEPRL